LEIHIHIIPTVFLQIYLNISSNGVNFSTSIPIAFTLQVLSIHPENKNAVYQHFIIIIIIIGKYNIIFKRLTLL